MSLRQRLLIDPTEHPMLLAESSINTAHQREKYPPPQTPPTHTHSLYLCLFGILFYFLLEAVLILSLRVCV